MSYDFAAAPPYTVVTASGPAGPTVLVKEPSGFGLPALWCASGCGSFTDDDAAREVSDVVEVARPVDEGWVTVNVERLRWAHKAVVDDAYHDGWADEYTGACTGMADWRAFLSAVTEGPDT